MFAFYSFRIEQDSSLYASRTCLGSTLKDSSSRA